MKTAISIPDELFREAERLRRELGISRSEFFQRALDQYLRQHDTSWVTEKLNRLLGPTGEGSELEPHMKTATRRQFARLHAEEAALKRRRRAG